MSELGESMIRGMQEALDFAQGKDTEAIAHIPENIDVARIRSKMKMSQGDFARMFGFSARTVQDWEQGRRVPTGPAKAFLHVIDHEPDAVRRVLSQHP